jgi:hypothetical protein
MLFSSFEFLVLFRPLALVGFEEQERRFAGGLSLADGQSASVPVMVGRSQGLGLSRR